MMLQNKVAIIYGAGGSLGSTVAKAFAGAGARVFLAGRNLSSVKRVADEINASGGTADADEVDATDETAVNDHIAGVLKRAGRVDISFNLVDLQVVQNKPLIEITLEEFVRPVSIAMQSHFLTGTAAVKAMMKQGRGVILTLTATPGGVAYPGTAGFAPACCAIEGLCRNLASENGQYGIRAVNIRSAGSPDSQVFKQAIENYPEEMKGVIGSMENDTMLKKLPLMADIANVAVFLASDLAGKITGVTVDVTSGTTAGLNYKSGNYYV